MFITNIACFRNIYLHLFLCIILLQVAYSDRANGKLKKTNDEDNENNEKTIKLSSFKAKSEKKLEFKPSDKQNEDICKKGQCGKPKNKDLEPFKKNKWTVDDSNEEVNKNGKQNKYISLKKPLINNNKLEKTKYKANGAEDSDEDNFQKKSNKISRAKFQEKFQQLKLKGDKKSIKKFANDDDDDSDENDSKGMNN